MSRLRQRSGFRSVSFAVDKNANKKTNASHSGRIVCKADLNNTRI